MLKTALLSFFALLFFFPSSGQVDLFLDSLKQDLKTVQDDSMQFRLLDELAWTYRRIDSDSALKYGNRSILLAEELNDDYFRGIAYSTRGVIKVDNALGDLGVSDFKKSLALNIKSGNTRGVSSNYNNLGNALERRGIYDSAIIYYSKSITAKLEIGRKASAASTMSNLGLVYMELENPEKAMEYFQQALGLAGGETRRLRGIYNNIGIAYSQLQNCDSARYYLKKVIEITPLENNESEYAKTYNNIAESFQDDKLYDSALYYAQLAFDLKKEFSSPLSMTYTGITLSKIYRETGNNTLAKKYALEARNIAKEYDNPERLAEAIWFLGQAEMSLENHEEAAALFQEYAMIKEDLTREAILQSAEDAEAKFQNELKEKENLILKEEAEVASQRLRFQRTVIISIATILILLGSMVLLFRKQLIVRKRLLKKIEAQSEKLKELDRAKTRFFANISHDLRSPLTLILGSLDKITERDYDVLDRESRELLEAGIKNGKRLLYLADEIMDLTRLEEGKVELELQYVKIVPYLRLLTKMFSSAADIKHIELGFNTQCEEETILQLDPHQFEKIIYNLLSNAIKFTPENGIVNVSLFTSSTMLEIAITDSGPGIPEESLDLIFDRYYQSADASTSQAGVGIGLALVKELVELHEGTVSARSTEQGTTFTISFPFRESDWVSKAIVPERSLDVVTRNSLWMDLQEEKEKLQVPSLTNLSEDAKTVLIVEDHKELRTYLKSILSSDFRVHIASNGSHALDQLQSEKIDLIITDLMMPYMDGFELIDHLKRDKELRKIPVLVVSARTDKSEKVALISKGAEDVISKPFDKEELVARIQNILSRDWDSEQSLGKLYNETAQEFEKNVMRRLERLIIKRIDDPHLSVLDLADEMAASERKVYRMIKKLSGLTPYELIKEIRWQYLESYLKKNQVQTATQAAQLIGMNNVSSFTSQYEKRFGHSFKEILSH